MQAGRPHYNGSSAFVASMSPSAWWRTVQAGRPHYKKSSGMWCGRPARKEPIRVCHGKPLEKRAEARGGEWNGLQP